jgi:hypothetical protein
MKLLSFNVQSNDPDMKEKFPAGSHGRLNISLRVGCGKSTQYVYHKWDPDFKGSRADAEAGQEIQFDDKKYKFRLLSPTGAELVYYSTTTDEDYGKDCSRGVIGKQFAAVTTIKEVEFIIVFTPVSEDQPAVDDDPPLGKK